MRMIGYIAPTQRYPKKNQRDSVRKYVLCDDVIFCDPPDGDFAENIKALREPGDTIVVPKLSVISRTRRDLERLVVPVLKRGFHVLESDTGNRVTDVETFVASLWAAQRQGPTKKQAQKAAAQSSGRSISPAKLNKARKIWRNPAYETVHEAAKAAGVSVSTMHRHFGRRFAIKQDERKSLNEKKDGR